MKAIKKQNKIFFSMAKQPGSRRELNNINNIKANTSKKHSYSCRNISSSGSYSSLSSDSE